MVINGKKYIVKVPTGKTTNDFQFDELLPAFRKYCAKVAQNQATRIVSYTSTLEVPKPISWAALLVDLSEQFRDCLGYIEHINTIPADKDGRYLLPRAVYDDFKTLNEVISCVGPAAWNQWDETSKLYWKSCVPRMRMLLEQSKVIEEK